MNAQTSMQTGAQKGKFRENAAIESYMPHREYWDCINRHYGENDKLDFLHLATALFGYDITKGMTVNMTKDKILGCMWERFGNVAVDMDNDKVVLASIGSTLQICATLATPVPGANGAGQMNFKLFCGFVERLYGCDLSDYDPVEIDDFRYHVMAFLKGRSSRERAGDYREESQKAE